MTETPAYHPGAQGLQGVIALSNEVERELARALAVNLTDYRALSALAMGGPVTVGGLAERLGTTAATTTAIVNRLEARGYADRERVDGDRRQVRVSVSPACFGRILGLMRPLMDATNAHLWSLPPEEGDAVARFLAVVQDHLRAQLDALASGEPS